MVSPSRVLHRVSHKRVLHAIERDALTTVVTRYKLPKPSTLPVRASEPTLSEKWQAA